MQSYKYSAYNGLYEGELMQFPPMKRTIFIRRKFFNWFPIQRRFYLPFPYMLFHFFKRAQEDWGRLSVAFASKPITSLEEQIICFPWLPNVCTSDWYVCLGEEKLPNIKSAINVFWNSPFTDEQHWRGSKAVKDIVGSYKKWGKFNTQTICEKVFLARSGKSVKGFLVSSYNFSLDLSKIPPLKWE
jgi:hypothetical protein